LEGIVKGWIISIIAVAVILSALLSISPSFSTTKESNEPRIKEILLIANEGVQRIVPDNNLYPEGLIYNTMTFNGTIPGPLISVNQGDILKITLRNEGKIIHSLNLHAGFGPTQALSGVVQPGESKTWTMKADYPGVFLYHCDGDNLNGIWEHIATGMYGGIIVHSPQEKPAKEFFVFFSEVYTSFDSQPGIESQIGSFDFEKFIDNRPDLILTNGMAFRYIPVIGTQAKVMLNSSAETFHVKTDELTRWYIFNAGPRNDLAFNFGAGMIPADNSEKIIEEGEKDAYRYDEIRDIPPGSGTVIEMTFPEKGTYFGNDHDIGSLLKGAGFVVIVDDK